MKTKSMLDINLYETNFIAKIKTINPKIKKELYKFFQDDTRCVLKDEYILIPTISNSEYISTTYKLKTYNNYENSDRWEVILISYLADGYAPNLYKYLCKYDDFEELMEIERNDADGELDASEYLYTTDLVDIEVLTFKDYYYLHGYKYKHFILKRLNTFYIMFYKRNSLEFENCTTIEDCENYIKTVIEGYADKKVDELEKRILTLESVIAKLVKGDTQWNYQTLNK